MQDKNKLIQKLEQELKNYKIYVKEQGVNFAIKKACFWGTLFKNSYFK